MKDKKNKILMREILFLLFVSFAVSLFFLAFARGAAGTIVYHYCEQMNLTMTEIQRINADSLIQSGSLIVSVLLFVVLFLFLAGQKLAYLQVIMEGIEALRIHRMDHEIPLEGENELTKLAESINYLSRTERELDAREKEMQEEREQLIRALSHDIRTPLTSMKGYTEYLLSKEEISQEEVKEYLSLMAKKAEQMKLLTDQLLENSRHNPEWMEKGRFLMEQLVAEWEEQLEESFSCQTDLTECPAFSGTIDVGEFQRIFDNLYSNVEKYADREALVELKVCRKNGRLTLIQKNKKKKDALRGESHKIGLLSIKSIAGHYGGSVSVSEGEDRFEIQISLLEIS